jgi:hypothetical protein
MVEAVTGAKGFEVYFNQLIPEEGACRWSPKLIRHRRGRAHSGHITLRSAQHW